MKKYYLGILVLISIFMMNNSIIKVSGADDHAVNEKTDVKTVSTDVKSSRNTEEYGFPDFYRGIYLNVASARNMKKLASFVEMAKRSHINTFVMDVQTSRYRECVVPLENVEYCIKNGIHPVARIVVFPEGLKSYPVPEWLIEKKMKIAESACKNGFREIQFDYIRFNDSKRLRYLTRQKRYEFIEGFLARAGKRLKKYDAKIAADVFGRIPLNRGDIIGQRMEGLDRVVDIICPMAYPSHYTWSKKLQHDPYYTVHWTSSQAKKRTNHAQIVTYIQAFQIKLGSMSFEKYIAEQIQAVHDSGVKGYFLWNAAQKYTVPLRVTRQFYSSPVSQREKTSREKAEDRS